MKTYKRNNLKGKQRICFKVQQLKLWNNLSTFSIAFIVVRTSDFTKNCGSKRITNSLSRFQILTNIFELCFKETFNSETTFTSWQILLRFKCSNYCRSYRRKKTPALRQWRINFIGWVFKHVKLPFVYLPISYFPITTTNYEFVYYLWKQSFFTRLFFFDHFSL